MLARILAFIASNEALEDDDTCFFWYAIESCRFWPIPLRFSYSVVLKVMDAEEPFQLLFQRPLSKESLELLGFLVSLTEANSEIPLGLTRNLHKFLLLPLLNDWFNRRSQPSEMSHIYECLKVFSALSSYAPAAAKEALTRDGFLATIVGLLKEVMQTDPLAGQAESFLDLKKTLISIMGNMAFRNTFIKDELHELQAPLLLLGNCGIDDENPCKLSLFCVLSLTRIHSHQGMVRFRHQEPL